MSEHVFFSNISNTDKPFIMSTAGVTLTNPNYRIISRKRGDTAFEYIISGKGFVRHNNKEYHLKAGDIFYIPMGNACEYFSDKTDPWIKTWGGFYGNLIPNVMMSYFPPDKIYFPAASSCYHFFKKINSVSLNRNLTVEEKSESVLPTIIEMIMHLHKLTEANAATGTSRQNAASVIKAYIDNHFNEPININDLSKQFFCCETHTLRLFKKAYGVTPYDYLINLRINTAKFLLKQTNMTIKEISFSVGYQNEHYFSTLFKKKVGKSPCEYRTNHFNRQFE